MKLGTRQRAILHRLREQDPRKPEQFGPRDYKAISGLRRFGLIWWCPQPAFGAPRYVAKWL